MEYISKQVRTLKNKYSTSNPYDLCDYLDIYIIITELPDKIYGFYSKVLGEKFIHLNNKLSKNKRKIVLAHEIGHSILHPNLNSLFIENSTLFSQSKFEKEADIFAAELLLDDDFFEKYHEENFTISQLSQVLNLPEKYVQIKWNNLNFD